MPSACCIWLRYILISRIPYFYFLTLYCLEEHTRIQPWNLNKALSAFRGYWIKGGKLFCSEEPSRIVYTTLLILLDLITFYWSLKLELIWNTSIIYASTTSNAPIAELQWNFQCLKSKIGKTRPPTNASEKWDCTFQSQNSSLRRVTSNASCRIRAAYRSQRPFIKRDLELKPYRN